ncbi:MAG: MBL fold metallo-hydrolase RNA specificity domain-containing protein [Halobacteriota archaeon]
MEAQSEGGHDLIIPVYLDPNALLDVFASLEGGFSTAEDVRENQEEYIFRCDFFELKELIDVKPDVGSSYIRSVCEPFDLEMELDLKKVENWLAHFGLYPYTQIHASGHLNYDEIRDVVETVKPKVLIPVHTQHPEVFKNFHDNVVLPEKGIEISI